MASLAGNIDNVRILGVHAMRWFFTFGVCATVLLHIGCSCSPQGKPADPTALVLNPDGTAGKRRDISGTTIEPMTYRDTKTGITLYCERDGQTVSAIDPTGKLLWSVNATAKPQTDWRKHKPLIHWIGPALPWQINAAKIAGKTGDFVAIGFFKEGWLLNLADGDLFFSGND
jgi:hypothetical protein